MGPGAAFVRSIGRDRPSTALGKPVSARRRDWPKSTRGVDGSTSSCKSEDECARHQGRRYIASSASRGMAGERNLKLPQGLRLRGSGEASARTTRSRKNSIYPCSYNTSNTAAATTVTVAASEVGQRKKTYEQARFSRGCLKYGGKKTGDLKEFVRGWMKSSRSSKTTYLTRSRGLLVLTAGTRPPRPAPP